MSTKWKPVKVKMKLEQLEPISPQVTVEYLGTSYGAATCYVHFGRIPVEATAVFAGQERFITTREAALKWLTDRALPYAMATDLLVALSGPLCSICHDRHPS